MIPTAKIFDLDLLVKYGNRKKPGRVSFFVAAAEGADFRNSGEIFPLPNTGRDEHEHRKYCQKIRREQGISLERLIPAHIDTNGLEVIGVSTGYSGMEEALKIRHKRKDVEYAHRRIWEFIRNGSVPVGKLQEDKIVYRYCRTN